MSRHFGNREFFQPSVTTVENADIHHYRAIFPQVVIFHQTSSAENFPNSIGCSAEDHFKIEQPPGQHPDGDFRKITGLGFVVKKSMDKEVSFFLDPFQILKIGSAYAVLRKNSYESAKCRAL
ncbi:hypothetical protein Nham_4024 [Nitrobacter hamburgensis X14]|uniref:Uncharacterized protein n=1 Tax=Nitrobacter hamburgensis (strain DSM 10229 / NCIMB 13809 / X14) TaxID=323097 RepID=Q1QGF4_NITHX|nr:hypothetical protein Nham_4024 [Nitrobacter hamburgensis X14]